MLSNFLLLILTSSLSKPFIASKVIFPDPTTFSPKERYELDVNEFAIYGLSAIKGKACPKLIIEPSVG